MKLLKILDEKLELTLCIALMSMMTAIIFIQVIMRYVFRNSLVWSEEMARYMFIWLIYLGISYGAKIMKHIKIEAALGMFPVKMRPYIVILGDVLFLAFSIFIVFTSFNIVQKQLVLKQESPAIHMPIWIIYAAPLVGFLLTAIRQVQTILYRVKILKEGVEIDG